MSLVNKHETNRFFLRIVSQWCLLQVVLVSKHQALRQCLCHLYEKSAECCTRRDTPHWFAFFLYTVCKLLHRILSLSFSRSDESVCDVMFCNITRKPFSISCKEQSALSQTVMSFLLARWSWSVLWGCPLHLYKDAFVTVLRIIS